MGRERTIVAVVTLAVTAVASAAAPSLARDAPLPGVARVEAGVTHTCADWYYGSSCWGDNSEAKLGNGLYGGLLLAPVMPPTLAPQAVLAPLPPIMATPFGSIDAGPTRTCALATGQRGTVAGEVWCWGEAPLGRVCFGGDYGAENDPGVVRTGPPGEEDGPDECGQAPLASAYAIAVAEHRACALVGSPYATTGGEVWCWDDTGGQADFLAHPLLDGAGQPVAGIVALDGAFDSFCGIAVDSTVWCWDDLGDAAPEQVPAPLDVASGMVPGRGLNGVVAITVGGDHACAQLRDGGVWCWGSNERGQLGDGTTTLSASPVRVTGLDGTAAATAGDPSDTPFASGRPWRILAAGRAHMCVLRADEPSRYQRARELFCWGANENGQLGDGSRDDRLAPVRVADLDPELGLFDLAAGAGHTCVVTGETSLAPSIDPTIGGISSDRTLRCWGANEHGQLGTGDRDARTRPAVVVMTDEARLAERPWPDQAP